MSPSRFDPVPLTPETLARVEQAKAAFKTLEALSYDIAGSYREPVMQRLKDASMHWNEALAKTQEIHKANMPLGLELRSFDSPKCAEPGRRAQ